MFRNAIFNIEAIFAIEKLIQKIKPDVVMTNTIVSPWAALAANFQGVPHIWFVREYGDIDHQHVFELGREKMLQDIDILSDLIVTNSKTLAKHISEYVSKEKVIPLYTPFDLEGLEKKSLQKVTNPFKRKDSLKLVITGRIAPSKGQSEAAEAAAKLIKQGYDSELCVIGLPADPADADNLNNVIEKYGISDSVHLVGQQSNPLAILKLADVGIMASRQEAFGRVTFEYMATGRPVVGANSGATPEMIDDGVNGYLYDSGDVESLTDKLLLYAKNRDLISQQGAAAKLKTEKMMASQFTADKLFERIQTALATGQYKRHPLNFSHRWLEYPSIAQQYIKDSGAISLKRLLYKRLRSRLKWGYLTGMRVVNFIRRGGKRSSKQ